MFYGDDVVWLVGQNDVVFVDQTVLAKLVGSLSNLPT
jgi:hypothetical protein